MFSTKIPISTPYFHIEATGHGSIPFRLRKGFTMMLKVLVPLVSLAAFGACSGATSDETGFSDIVDYKQSALTGKYEFVCCKDDKGTRWVEFEKTQADIVAGKICVASTTTVVTNEAAGRTFCGLPPGATASPLPPTGKVGSPQTTVPQQGTVLKPPVQNPPVQNAPVQNPPVQSPPVQNAPVQNPPVQNAPVQNPPVQSQTGSSAPIQIPPATNPQQQQQQQQQVPGFEVVVKAGVGSYLKLRPVASSKTMLKENERCNLKSGQKIHGHLMVPKDSKTHLVITLTADVCPQFKKGSTPYIYDADFMGIPGDVRATRAPLKQSKGMK